MLMHEDVLHTHTHTQIKHVGSGEMHYSIYYSVYKNGNYCLKVSDIKMMTGCIMFHQVGID